MIIFLIIFSSFFLNFECEECDICTVSKNYAECDAMYVCPQNVTTIYATCLLKKIKSTTRIKQVLIRGDCENIGRFKLLCRFPIDEVLLRKHHITWKCRTASGAKETSAESTGGSDLATTTVSPTTLKPPPPLDDNNFTISNHQFLSSYPMKSSTPSFQSDFSKTSQSSAPHHSIQSIQRGQVTTPFQSIPTIQTGKLTYPPTPIIQTGKLTTPYPPTPTKQTGKLTTPYPPTPTLQTGKLITSYPPIPTLQTGKLTTPYPPTPILQTGKLTTSYPPIPTLQTGKLTTPYPPTPTLQTGKLTTSYPPTPTLQTSNNTTLYPFIPPMQTGKIITPFQPIVPSQTDQSTTHLQSFPHTSTGGPNVSLREGDSTLDITSTPQNNTLPTYNSNLVQQAFAIALTVAGIVLLAILFKILKWLRRRCLSDLEFRSPVVRRRRARRHPLLSFNVTPSYRMNSTRRSSV